jgi:hypothetical protein
VPAKTSRVRAAVVVDVADAVVAGVVVEKKDVTVRCRARPMANAAQNRAPARGVCLPVQHITKASSGQWPPSRTNDLIVPWHASQMDPTTVDSDRTQSAKVTATERRLRLAAAGGVVEVAVAVVAVTAKVRSAVSAHRPIAKAASSPDGPLTAHPAVLWAIPPEISMMSPCLPAMGFGSPPNQATRPDRMHPGRATATPLAPQRQKTVSRVRRAAVDADDADGAKAAARAPAAPRHLPPKEAARAPQAGVRAVPPRAAANAVAAAAGGVAGRNAVRHRPLIAVVAMSSPPWLADGRRTTRALSFSASRMLATMAAPATSDTLPTMMTASSRAVSMRCSTFPAGWRRSGLSSPAISMPAAVRPGVEMVAAVEENHGATPRHAAAHRKGPGNHAAAAAQATSVEVDGECFSQPQEFPGGSRGAQVAFVAPRPTPIRDSPTTRCPRTSVRGFLSNARQARMAG